MNFALRILWLLGLIAVCLGTTPTAVIGASWQVAARPIGDETGDKPATTAGQRWRSANSVKSLQKFLADLGLYIGPIDGHLDDETRGAIRVYQKSAGLKVDGKISRDLLNLLQNAVEVRALLKRLDRVRKSGKDAARQALLNHPATRDLVRDENTERANPTRDKDACFENLTVRCLLDEASESVKAVFRPELRDWALGEILVSQARAGLTQAAMLTARRIRDPRLIMVALRDIAEAEAAAGMGGEALQAARIIPDLEKRIEAMAAIAGIQNRRGEKQEAQKSVAGMIALLPKVKGPVKRISYRARAAVLLAQSGDLPGANREMAFAEKSARARTEDSEVGMALRFVASALADMEMPAKALNLLDDIPSKSERTSVLVSAANAQARAGDAAAALATADTIEAVRFRTVVLGRVALAQAQNGDAESAEATLQIALAAVDNIKVPFARSYAISRIALAMAHLVKPDTDADPPKSDESLSPLTYLKATETAARIDDNRLRAQTLWAIAAAQRTAGDVDGADVTETKAEDATARIISKLSRVWMFGEMAANYARRRDKDQAWTTFERGIKAARIIENPWGRSRAMARMATTLIELVDPKSSRLQSDGK